MTPIFLTCDTTVGVINCKCLLVSEVSYVTLSKTNKGAHMLSIQFDENKPWQVMINGEIYVKSPTNSEKTVFDFFDFNAKKDDWSFLGAAEIFEIMNGRKPKTKAEITLFALNKLNSPLLEKKRSSKNRMYKMPPVAL